MATRKAEGLWRIAGWLAGGAGTEEVVTTRVEFPGEPEAAWESLVTYEEVKRQPPWWLRVLLPQPVGTKGDKTQVGAAVPCRYESGGLVKRITEVRAPWYLGFDVVDQRVGIEEWLEARGGSYEIRAKENGASEVELTTRYVGRLWPRWVWRRVEAAVAHAFHRHILEGMKEEAAACRMSVSRSHR